MRHAAAWPKKVVHANRAFAALYMSMGAPAYAIASHSLSSTCWYAVCRVRCVSKNPADWVSTSTGDIVRHRKFVRSRARAPASTS